MFALAALSNTPTWAWLVCGVLALLSLASLMIFVSRTARGNVISRDEITLFGLGFTLGFGFLAGLVPAVAAKDVEDSRADMVAIATVRDRCGDKDARSFSDYIDRQQVRKTENELRRTLQVCAQRDLTRALVEIRRAYGAAQTP